jgi:hypothetical protein
MSQRWTATVHDSDDDSGVETDYSSKKIRGSTAASCTAGNSAARKAKFDIDSRFGQAM